MDVATREFVRRRAGHCCEYCRLPQASTPFIAFPIDHVIAQQHLDDDSDQNLALACDRCNSYKGTNLSSVDPVISQIVPLFNPRLQAWNEHFELHRGRIDGKSPAGRATAKLLQMNSARRVELRREWVSDVETHR
jgi:5-methylcytosine-specific restriction endonuclease McrA